MTLIADLPELAPLLDAEARLTAPGAPFELTEGDVLGERMLVYVNRPRSLRQILDNAASHGDEGGYVFDDGTVIGFTDVAGRAASVAAWLRDEHGVGPGDRVAIGAPNTPEWVLAFWACTATGAVVVAMNGWWTATEMQHALDLTEPKVVLLDERRRQRLGDASGHNVVPLEDVGVPEPSSEPLPPADIAEDDPAILIFTSGTTGRPKAGVLTHRSVCGYMMQMNFIGARGVVASGRPAPSGPPPKRLAVFPLFHVSGLGAIVSTLLTGATTVWPLGRFDAGKVIALTKEHGIALWSGAHTHILRLLDHPEIETLDPLSIQSVGIGGSASTPDLIRKTEERFPHLKGTFSSGYGSTETGSLVSYATNWMLVAAPHCIGPPLPGVEVEIRDDDGKAVPDGEEGNIFVRSQLCMRDYWRNDEANADTVLPGRWIKTGDFGFLDRGVLYLAARKRDLILRGGENIYPFEIENRLAEHPDVHEVAVIGVDHDELGQEVKAVVVPRPGVALDPAALQSYCAETLSSYKVPSIVEIRTEPMPRNATGKIMKHVLAGAADNSFIEE